ncbi:hypothetical protein UA08_08806 [Talaromyces atroroseus]|uniref:Uncharacterized protein n=1 Tax=Talaromyces atroroseus TaxID=1441469 RepID=A0A225AN97_TALAT|nr:hypothetical protein UA08_08806 [Talaromyces atroroseus]OKL55905.1 hypothetical protein UA08_08806 [Talaromyces atroroseus]
MINALHTREDALLSYAIPVNPRLSDRTGLLHDTDGDGEEHEPATGPDSLPKDLGIILISAMWPALFICLCLTVKRPQIGFGHIHYSPDFLRSGMAMDPDIVLHMLTGAIVGWGISSPYSKAKGWAPGDVGGWETGNRDWLIWISLPCLMADTLAKMI